MLWQKCINIIIWLMWGRGNQQQVGERKNNLISLTSIFLISEVRQPWPASSPLLSNTLRFAIPTQYH